MTRNIVIFESPSSKFFDLLGSLVLEPNFDDPIGQPDFRRQLVHGLAGGERLQDEGLLQDVQVCVGDACSFSTALLIGYKFFLGHAGTTRRVESCSILKLKKILFGQYSDDLNTDGRWIITIVMAYMLSLRSLRF